MTWTPANQRRLDELIDREANGGGLLLDESRECRGLEVQYRYRPTVTFGGKTFNVTSGVISVSYRQEIAEQMAGPWKLTRE